MLNQPTSSPMMKRMLGFLSAASAGDGRAEERRREGDRARQLLINLCFQ